MKSFLIPILIAILLLSASLSLVSMKHMSGQGHNDCPLQAVGITDCTGLQNSLNFITSHLSATSVFYSAIPANNLIAFFVSLFVLVFAVVIALSNKPKLVSLRPVFIRYSDKPFVPTNKILLNRWFALHENSPALVGGR